MNNNNNINHANITTTITSTQENATLLEDQKSTKNKSYKLLLAANFLSLFLGSLSSTLLSKFYFLHKGSSRWVSTWVQSAGFPLLLLPIYLSRRRNCRHGQPPPFSSFTPKTILLSILIGLLLGLNNLLFSWGNSYLPVSTSSLLLSSQLIFTLLLSALIVNQSITFHNLNTVLLLTLSSVLLALSSSHDKSPSISKSKYFIGFFSTVGAGLLFALYLPVMEKVYRSVHTYVVVMEMQLVMEASATALAAVGMAFDGGFAEMGKESREVFDAGEKVYWATVLGNVVTWQMCFMGTAGMVFLTSSLTGGICMTALLAVNVLGGVVVNGDEFGGVKAVSTVLCGWGFCSYVYGMYVKMKNGEKDQDQDQETKVGDDLENNENKNLNIGVEMVENDNGAAANCNV